MLDFSTPAKKIETAIELIDAGMPEVRFTKGLEGMKSARYVVQSVLAEDGNLVDFSDEYICGRAYLLGGQFEKARARLTAAPEQDVAAFDIAAIDTMIAGAPPKLQGFKKGIHSDTLLQICVNAMAAAGKSDEAVAFLDALDAGVGAPVHPTTKIEPIFFCTMAKSGTSFLSNALKQLTGVPSSPATHVLGDGEILIRSWVDAACKAGKLPSGHWSPEERSTADMLHFGMPVFMTIRDPREATWSWFRYMEENPTLWKIALPYLPRDYSERSYDERKTLMFQGYFPVLVQWIRNWKSFLETHPDHRVLIVRYEDFAKDNAPALKSLLSLCGAYGLVDKADALVQQMRDEGAKTGRYHFRIGKAAGWRGEATREMTAAIDAHWDAETLYYFDYQK